MNTDELAKKLQELSEGCPPQKPIERRLGRFQIMGSAIREALSGKALGDEFDLYRQIMGRVVVLKAEPRDYATVYEYHALSPDFDLVALGTEPPVYAPQCYLEEGKPVFKGWIREPDFRWSKSPPNDVGHWWWLRDQESLAVPVDISFGYAEYIAEAGQHGWTTYQQVTAMEGWWQRIESPGRPA